VDLVVFGEQLPTGDPAKISEILPDIFFGYLPRDGHCKLGQGFYFRHRD
jgi:hypothetical protein